VPSGTTLENFQRMWSDLTDRPSGPMGFRFILQRLTAAVAVLRDGPARPTDQAPTVSLDKPRRPQERIDRLRDHD
jgi:hypothetical protein